MKTISFELLNKKFDDQYTFDLQGYLSFQDFTINMKTLNRSIKQTPLPRHRHLWVSMLWFLWLASACIFYIVYMQDLPLWIILLLSLILLIFTCGFIYIYQRRIHKFETVAMEACDQLNETERTRGISYQLWKNGDPCPRYQTDLSWYFMFGAQSIYEMVIQFDDRYNQRYSKDFVSVPLYSALPGITVEDEKSNEINSPFLSSDEKSQVALSVV
ncbi:uncharacterized protein BX664DRAFT_344893 [Halteromyces radiatus]|uniref:uncharacterized protein n=1 Tax=Halteromyces radiatus TaxID=101107 RepID=UPI0022210E8A|nr:uncharacterized protein BX664DRAFT_344893 [Halteromyces radiatus]KAI8098752.1 hypothetical protein BX664DRAFT_344893 [Halteromyces radiatus]